MTTPIRAAQEAQIQANLYRICSSFLLTPPSKEFLYALASSPIPGFVVDTAWDLDELHQEFHALFLVPANKYLFPYESCYRARRNGRPGRLMGEPALAVQAFYTRAGLAVSSEACELPDHAGLEFSFLQLLAEKEASAWQDSAEEQARHWHCLQMDFFHNHLIHWIPDLCAEIKATTTHSYFTGLAGWIEEVLQAISCLGVKGPVRRGVKPEGEKLLQTEQSIRLRGLK